MVFMLAVKWTKEFNGVAVPEIDEEHQALFQLAGQIEEALSAGAILGALEAQLQELVGDVTEHFSHEEKMMKAGRYPAYSWHKGQHNVVRNKVAELVRAQQEGDRETVLRSLDYIVTWLKTHTAVSDRMMAAFFRTNPTGKSR